MNHLVEIDIDISFLNFFLELASFGIDQFIYVGTYIKCKSVRPLFPELRGFPNPNIINSNIYVFLPFSHNFFFFFGRFLYVKILIEKLNILESLSIIIF